MTETTAEATIDVRIESKLRGVGSHPLTDQFDYEWEVRVNGRRSSGTAREHRAAVDAVLREVERVIA